MESISLHRYTGTDDFLYRYKRKNHSHALSLSGQNRHQFFLRCQNLRDTKNFPPALQLSRPRLAAVTPVSLNVTPLPLFS